VPKKWSPGRGAQDKRYLVAKRDVFVERIDQNQGCTEALGGGGRALERAILRKGVFSASLNRKERGLVGPKGVANGGGGEFDYEKKKGGGWKEACQLQGKGAAFINL